MGGGVVPGRFVRGSFPHIGLFALRTYGLFFLFFLSLHTAIRPLGHSRQVYIVHCGLQDEGLQLP